MEFLPILLLLSLCLSLNLGQVHKQLPRDIKEYDVTSVRILQPSRRIKGGNTDTTHLSFSAFGKRHSLRLQRIKTKSPYGEYGIPVSILDDHGTLTKMINLERHGVEFYEGSGFRGVFAIHNNGTNSIAITNTLTSTSIRFCHAIQQKFCRNDQRKYGVVHQVTEDLVMEPVIVKGVHTTDHVVYKRSRVKGNLHGDTLTKRSGSGFRYNSFDPGSMTGGSNFQSGHNFGQFHPGSLDGTGRSSSFFLSDGGIQVVQKPSLVKAEVEVLVWTDLSFMYSFQKLLGNSNIELEILKYITVVVHSGNLLFHHGVGDPSLNISVTLSGVIICKTINCSRFTYDHASNGGVDNHIALDHFADTLKESFHQNSLNFRYDYAVAFTRLDLTDPHGTPIGVSFTDEICSIQNGKSSSILEDQGGFSCIGTFVHEMSHTLGCDHDGWFRSRQCSPSDGYIMSAVSPLTKNGFYFSRCSVDSIKQNLIKPNASCVTDHGHSNYLYQALGRSQLPGQIYNRTQQCQQIYGTNFCLSIGTTLEDICYKMYCWDPILPNVCSTKSAAAPGTSCGHHKWCVNGECIYSSDAP